MHKLKIGRLHVPVPSSRPMRLALGSTLVVLGVLGFLPILGFWMLPLGLIILSLDIPRIRRLRRRLWVWRKQKRSSTKI